MYKNVIIYSRVQDLKSTILFIYNIHSVMYNYIYFWHKYHKT